jgi:hypothetical protein
MRYLLLTLLPTTLALATPWNPLLPHYFAPTCTLTAKLTEHPPHALPIEGTISLLLTDPSGAHFPSLAFANGAPLTAAQNIGTTSPEVSVPGITGGKLTLTVKWEASWDGSKDGFGDKEWLRFTYGTGKNVIWWRDTDKLVKDAGCKRGKWVVGPLGYYRTREVVCGFECAKGWNA